MNINFVYDKISKDKIFESNIVDVSPFDGLRPNWVEWGSETRRHLPWEPKLPLTSKHNIDFIGVNDVRNTLSTDLNIYPIFCHSTAFAYPWPIIYLSKNVIDLVNDNKLKILLSCTFEPSTKDLDSLARHLFNFMSHQKITRFNNIIIGCTDYKIQDRLKKTKCFEIFNNDHAPKFVNLDIYQSQTMRVIMEYYSKYKIENFLDIYNSKQDKDKIFLFLNGRPVAYRFILYKLFEMKNILSHSYYTWRNPITANEIFGDTQSVKNHWGFSENHSDILNYITSFPQILENKFHENHNGNLHWSPFEVGCYINEDWIKDTYFSVVTETHIWTEISQVTEKIYKLFYYCHPFIVLGSKGFLKELHRLGYKTFPELFDESYDDMDYSVDKLKFIVDQVNQYTTPEGKERLKKILPIISETLRYNREKFISQDMYDRYANLA